MNAVLELERVGYSLTIDGDQIRYALAPGKEVDAATVKPMLEELRAHKEEAITFLRQRDTLPLTLAGADPAEEARAKEQLRRQGYFLMHSRELGERIAIVEHDRFRANVPQGIPSYSLKEVRLLQQGVEAGTITTIGDLRAMHEAKKKLGGVIVR